MLAGIVEHRRLVALAVGELHDLLQGLALQRRVLLDEAVQRRHIGLMVLAVVQLQRFLAHAGPGQGRGVERQRGKLESHDALHLVFLRVRARPG